MSFSSGFTTEIQKAHGDALAARVYVRLNDPINGKTNFWDPSTNRMSYSFPTTGSCEESTSGSPSPTDEKIYNLYTESGFGDKSFQLNNGDLYLSDSLCFSVFVWSGSTTGGTYDSRLLVSSYTGATDDWGTYEDGFYMHYRLNGDSCSITSSGGDQFVTGGSIAIGSGWTRVYMVGTQPETDRGTRRYLFQFSTNYFSASSASLIHTSPMIESNVGYPTDFIYKPGIAVYPSSLDALADYETTLNMNPIQVKREREFGVVQGQDIQIQVAGVDPDFNYSELANSVCAVQIGLPLYDIWETFYQGTIGEVEINTDYIVNLNLNHATIDLINQSLERDTNFGTECWVGNVEAISRAGGSESYDMSPFSGGLSAVTINPDYSGYVQDDTYRIVFDTDTAFRIYNSYGQPLKDMSDPEWTSISGTQFSTSGDSSFSPLHFFYTGTNVFTLSKSGWTAGSGKYVVGDTFEFTTSYARTTDQLTPYGMVIHLIEDVAGVKVYDVMNGGYYSSPLYDRENLTGGTFDTGSTILGGLWKKGSRIIEMVQDAMKLEHGSIYPHYNGQIALWTPIPSTTSSKTLNGNPSNGDCNVLEASTSVNKDDYANGIVVEYKDLATGEDKSVNVQNYSKYYPAKTMTIKTKWQVADSAAYVCASRALYRFDAYPKKYTLICTLALADVEMDAPVSIYDDFIGVAGEQVGVVEKQINVMNQRVGLVAWNDPLATINVARIDITEIDDPDEFVW